MLTPGLLSPEARLKAAASLPWASNQTLAESERRAGGEERKAGALGTDKASSSSGSFSHQLRGQSSPPRLVSVSSSVKER